MSNTATQQSEIAKAIKTAVTEINAAAGRAIRIWEKADMCRLYTDGQGYIAIHPDGAVEKIKRMGWGHIIDEALTAIGK